jgi:hypothetical protein
VRSVHLKGVAASYSNPSELICLCQEPFFSRSKRIFFATCATTSSGSVLDTLLANGATRVPFNTRVVSVTSGFIGYALGELSQKRFSALSLTAGTLTPIKCVAQTLVSEELVKFSDPGAVELFNRDLSLSMVRTVDGELLTRLLAGVTPTASAGTTAANFRTDVAKSGTRLRGSVPRRNRSRSSRGY